MSKDGKAKRRLGQSRKCSWLKAQIRLNESKLASIAKQLEWERKEYESVMLKLYRDADLQQQARLEET
jgi:hypothetical protein